MEYKELKLGPCVYKLVFDNAAAFNFEDEFCRRFGRERSLVPQFLSDCAFYFADASAMTEDKAQRLRGPSLRELSVALWALANTHHVRARGRESNPLTVEKLQGEMRPTDYAEYVGVIVQTINAALPKDTEGGESARPFGPGESASGPSVT